MLTHDELIVIGAHWLYTKMRCSLVLMEPTCIYNHEQPDVFALKGMTAFSIEAKAHAGVSLNGKDICGIDFTKAKNLTARQLFEAEKLDGVKLPDGMDFSGVSLKGKNIKGIGFSKVKNLTARHIFEADCLDYVILPADIIPGVSLEGNTITIYKKKA